jgi:CHASE3 domain sensor protein
MTDSVFPTLRKRRAGTDFSISFGLVAVLFFFVASGLISYWNTRILSNDSQQVVATHEIILAMDDLVSLMKDAETGQRGFILTGNEKYLTPYANALTRIDDRVADVERMTIDEPAQQTRIPAIRAHIAAKLDELAETIELRRSKGFDAALAVVISDRGKGEMDALRAQVGAMQQEERDVRAKRLTEMEAAYRLSVASGILTGVLGVLLSLAVAYLVRRNVSARQKQDWLQSGQVGLNSAMSGEQRIEQLAGNVLNFLTGYFDAHAGVIYAKEADGYRRLATYGASGDTPERFALGDGLLGQAAKDGRAFIVRDVPDGYLSVGSALGRSKPKHLLITPTMSDGLVNAVIELGFIHPLDELSIELLNQVSADIGIALRSASYRAHLQNLLEETQRQAEELQAQSEELRVSNEELEEQSRALKSSQTSLEQQQAELEQTNAQLEEQTQLLEDQRDDLARSGTMRRRPCHGPRADGCHDARNGRHDRHPRNPQASRMEKTAGHHAHRQGDERRSGTLSRSRGQRLHGQTARCRKTAVAGARVDAEIVHAA